MTRGILSSCYAQLRPEHLENDDPARRIRELYEDYYRDHPFVVVTSNPPQTKQTLGNNQCLVFPVVDSRTGRLIVISCIDNLVKGAAGQAVQNMNLMFGWPEDLALDSVAVYP